MIKKILILSALFITSWSFAAWASDGLVQAFGGLDTQNNPASLQPYQSQDLLNVLLQPQMSAVYKRDGYGLFQTLPISTSGVHGGYHFQQTGGKDVQLWGNDVNLNASVGDGAFIAVGAGKVNATWQCTDNLGFAYCVTNSGTDQMVKTDGIVADTSYVTGIPSGTIVASTPLQLVLAGVPSTPSTIYVSANNNFSNFTPSVLATDPYTEIINSPGSRITHLGYYFGNIFWWKDQSFGYISGSANQNTVQVTIVSNQIGTLDNSSAFWNPTNYAAGQNNFGTNVSPTSQGNQAFNEVPQAGGIYFRGQDSQIYEYDGYNLTRISRVISPTLATSNSRKSNSLSQSSQADFNGGSYSTTTYSASNGGVIVTALATDTPDHSFEQGSGSWTITAGDGSIVSASQGTDHCGAVSAFDGINYFLNQGNTSNYTIFVTAVNGSNVTCSTTTIGYVSGACGWQAKTLNMSGCAGQSVTLKVASDASGGGKVVAKSAFTSSGANIIFNTQSDSLVSAGKSLFFLDDFIGGANIFNSSGVYYSSVQNAPNLTSWSSFSSNYSAPGNSTQNFFVRSATNTFSILSSTPAWVSQTPGAIVASSTGTYFQLKDSFTVTAATETPILSNFVFNWFEGSASDKAYITYFNDAIWISVSTGASTSTNNTIFYLDLINNAWLKHNIASDGFAIENNALYLGDPTSGKIYKYGGVTTDNGSAIKAYWKSKDFLGTDPTTANQYNQADFIFAESSGTVSYTYTLDQTSSTIISLGLFDSSKSIIDRSLLLAKDKIGRFYSFMIGDNSANSAWKMMFHHFQYVPLSWKPNP